jgi:acyl-CoA thioester hydrolase
VSDQVYRHEIVVTENAIDLNGHVNNVVFVQWMQDVAVRHFGSIVSREMMQASGAIWVVRSHHIEYLSPAFAGDRIEVQTWIVNFSRVRSLRRYKFLRLSDNKLIVRGETDWVFVSATTGKPISIPENISTAFPLIAEDVDPS